MANLSTGSSSADLIPGLLFTGFGIGIVNPAIAKIGLGVVEPQRSGMASGISNTFRIGGLATGVAALGAVFQHQVTSELASHGSLGVPASTLAKTLTSGGIRAAAALSPQQPSDHSGVASSVRVRNEHDPDHRRRHRVDRRGLRRARAAGRFLGRARATEQRSRAGSHNGRPDLIRPGTVHWMTACCIAHRAAAARVETRILP